MTRQRRAIELRQGAVDGLNQPQNRRPLYSRPRSTGPTPSQLSDQIKRLRTMAPPPTDEDPCPQWMNCDDKPPPPPPPPAKVCGPDITEQVFEVLNKMSDDWKTWGELERYSRCTALLWVATGSAAWDIVDLSPQITPMSKDTFATDGIGKDYDEYLKTNTFWFEGKAKMCAKPRSPCGPTVTFLGQCVHAQQVNYIQWGLINKLCDQVEAADKSHRTRNAVKGVFDHVDAAQRLMVEIGKAYVPYANSRARRQSLGMYRSLDAAGQRREDHNAMANKLDELKKKKEFAGYAKRPEAACKMSCKISKKEAKALKERKFKYIWTGLTGRDD